MTLTEYQNRVDQWIKEVGVRYFDILTNTLILNEEVGELSSLIARKYGEQSFKRSEDSERSMESIKEEIADVLFVLTCISNQQNISLEEIVEENFLKKTRRDKDRHRQNKKLNS